MTILTIGSVNIDHTYRVNRHPGPGETMADKGYFRGLGGKGANQSLAAALAGAAVRHAGAIGEDGRWCSDQLHQAGIDVTDLHVKELATGHAVIMVDDYAENIILIHAGANHALTPEMIDTAIGRAAPGDWALVQNETNLVPEAAQAARAAGLQVAYAAAPFEPAMALQMVGLVDLLAVNQIEAQQMAMHLGCAPEALPVPALLITRGADGCAFHVEGQVLEQPAFAVEAVDTTGAGDTFLGYLLAGLDRKMPVPDALRRASAAAAIQVTCPGAAEAIPTVSEVDAFLLDQRP